MLHNLIFFIQVVLTISLVVLMAVQTDKAEQGGGGVMGLGAAGGRQSGNINMAVGAERILKPVTKWVAIGFLFSSVLSTVPDAKLNIGTVAIVVGLYLMIMLFGDRVWKAVTGAL